MGETDDAVCVEDKKISYGIFHRKTKIKGKLFPSSDGEPKASDVRQGYTDLDCYLLAVLSSIAHKSPKKIKACFVEYYDESGRERTNAPDFEKAKDIKIRLFIGEGRKIIIKVDKTALRNKGVAWVRLLEKAILVYRAKGYDSSVDSPYKNSQKIKSRLIDGTKGGCSRNMILAITGQKSGYISIRGADEKVNKKFTVYTQKAEKIFEDIESLLNQGKNVVAYAKQTSLFKIYRKGLFFCHVYSVIGTSKQIKNGREYKFVKVRNPYANRIREYNQGRNGKIHSKVRVPKEMDQKGVSDLELNDFIKNFEDITYDT